MTNDERNALLQAIGYRKNALRNRCIIQLVEEMTTDGWNLAAGYRKKNEKLVKQNQKLIKAVEGAVSCIGEIIGEINGTKQTTD